MRSAHCAKGRAGAQGGGRRARPNPKRIVVSRPAARRWQKPIDRRM